MSQIRIILGSDVLAKYPEGGGLWSCFLAYFLGLNALRHDVWWLEVLWSSGRKERDLSLISIFFERMKSLGLSERCVLLLLDKRATDHSLGTAETFGRSKGDLETVCRSADLLWNLASSLQQPLLSLFRRRVLIDGDPGHLQVSALTCDMGIRDHDVFLSVGTKLADEDCDVPRLGVQWQPLLQFVYLPMWPAQPDPGAEAPFSTVTQWNWGQLLLGEGAFSISKRDAYLRYADLPSRSGRAFELAANISSDDQTGDRELLRGHGWKLTDPHLVAGSPETHRDYIRMSRAEFSCPKPIFRELKTGWFSDRSASYLASGRPVLAEDTGFSEHLPVGEGLIAFKTLSQALDGVAEIDRNYDHHSRAARRLAEEHLDSRICLPAMLDMCS